LPVEELKVRAHRVTFENDSEPLPARLRLEYDSETLAFDLELTRGQIVAPVRGKSCRVELDLFKPTGVNKPGTSVL
jgi:hypothetical protein